MAVHSRILAVLLVYYGINACKRKIKTVFDTRIMYIGYIVYREICMYLVSIKSYNPLFARDSGH